jgi:hypothetical protein
MSRRMRFAAAIVATVGVALAIPAPASAQSGVKIGTLTCNVASGFGFIIGSSKAINCTYHSGIDPRHYEHYTGRISKFGADIGYTQGGVLIWTVFAPQAQIGPGGLQGSYGGATAGATVGVGVSANALVGGSGNSIALQPLSIESNEGLNVAAGVAAMSLYYHPGP